MKELLHDDDVRMDARAEGWEEGLAEGMAQGIERGMEQGIEQGMERGMAQGIAGFIRDKLEDGADRETILRKLQKVYSLSKEEAEKYYSAVNEKSNCQDS